MKTTYQSLSNLGDKEYRAFLKGYEKLPKGKKWPIFCPEPIESREKWLVRRNPANLSQVAWAFPCATAQDVDRAVTRAMKSRPALYGMGFEGRREALRKLKALFIKRFYTIIGAICLETGKTWREAFGEGAEFLQALDQLLEFDKRTTHFVKILNDGSAPPFELSYTVLQPLGGVLVVLAPFNFPSMLLAYHVVNSLFLGNPTVLKPAPETALSGYLLHELLVEAGFPPEACPLVVGHDSVVGEALLHHPLIARIIFTGSRKTGQRVMDVNTQLIRRGVPRLFPTLEMGGKNPVIITEHTDVRKALRMTVASMLGATAQKCSSPSRVILVGEKVTKEAQDELAIIAEKGLPRSDGSYAPIIIGAPEAKDTSLGPLINATSFKRYHRVLEELLGDSSREFVMLGTLQKGLTFLENKFSGTKGYFVRPCIIWVDPNHPLSFIELFIPLLLAHQAVSFEQAVAIANAPRYGLSASLFSENKQEQRYFLENIEAGVLYIERPTTGAWPKDQTFSGWKDSGTSGAQAFSYEYLLNYSRPQVVTMKLPH